MFLGLKRFKFYLFIIFCFVFGNVLCNLITCSFVCSFCVFMVKLVGFDGNFIGLLLFFLCSCSFGGLWFLTLKMGVVVV